MGEAVVVELGAGARGELLRIAAWRLGMGGAAAASAARMAVA